MPQFEKTYRPEEIEAKWYRKWEEAGSFRADEEGKAEPYSIVIPPPNVTGVLHVGHALNNTLQDILVRWRRMEGKNVLWLPGMDHAGIATQNVVEKQLAAEKTDRHRLGREAFLERVWRWKEESGGTIITQLKRLGCSCDWDRERFTLDDGLSLAVREVFIRLYRDGLIYRDEKIINWCPRCYTALSDLEVEYHDQEGSLYHVRYPLVGEEGAVVVATTRPETIMGDTAVAVNPDDDRYASLVGKLVRLPVEPFREIPVIADTAVETSFGTGALKITPAHDAADFEIGRRHGLEEVKVIDELGTMTEKAGKYRGLERFAARKQVVEDLEKLGLLARTEDYTVPLGHCQRCRNVVEPALSPQWFVKAKPLAEPAIGAVKEKKTRIIPPFWEKTYYEWMENIRDWCISRQIWWGHQIPAWYCLDCNRGRLKKKEEDSPGFRKGDVSWSFDVAAEPIVAAEEPKECPACGGGKLVQDPDVLDTWFSSALWPFSTLGWPEKTSLLQTFYPTTVLVTGLDILFFWVARMMMMGLKFMGEVPFHEVYIHALVRDAEGKKMSKSKGNVIDPLGMMDAYGTDALRFTLTAMAAQGRDMKLSEERIAGYRNFVTKLWNATRLLTMHLEENFQPGAFKATALEDRWILSRLNALAGRVNEALTHYHFNDAASALYQFVWHEFCDWYLEMVKPRLSGEGEDGEGARQVSLYALRRLLELLHPIMPFVTEEISSRLPGERGMLVKAPFPVPDARWEDRDAEEQMELLIEIVGSVRTIRGEMNIKPSQEVSVALRNLPAAKVSLVNAMEALIRRLARVADLDMGGETPPSESATMPLSCGELFVPLSGVVDFNDEIRRLEKEILKLDKDVVRYEKKLGRKDFLERAPREVVEKDRRILAETKEKMDYLVDSRDRLRSWLGE